MPRHPPAVIAPADELEVVSGAEHRREGEEAHQGHHRPDDPGGGGEDRAGDDRGHRQRPGDGAGGELDALEQPVDDVGPLDDVAHEDEERDADQDVVGHHPAGALHHEVEDPVVEQGLRLLVEGVVPEEHPQPHQGEGGGEAQHDRHHDQGQHQQARRGRW